MHIVHSYSSAQINILLRYSNTSDSRPPIFSYFPSIVFSFSRYSTENEQTAPLKKRLALPQTNAIMEIQKK